MKGLIVGITGVVAVCLLSLGIIALHTDNPFIQRGGINPHSAPVKLLPKADAQAEAVAYLNPGEFAEYITSGATKKWHYIQVHGRDLVIYHKKFKRGFYQFSDIVLSKQQVSNGLMASAAVVFVCAFLYMVWFARWLIRLVRSRRNQSKVHKQPPPTRSPQSIESKCNPPRQPQPQVDIDRLQREAFQRGVQVGEEQTKEQALRDIATVKVNLEKNLKTEFEKQREATVREMKASYDALNVEYNDALKKAQVFDVDIHDDNFDKLLKGRLFEICIAEMLTKNNDFTLLEWTPDKGFGKNIFVASNLHPDLVFKNRAGEQFAIECKYRAGFDTFRVDQYTDAVSWCKTKSFANYQTFASKRNIPVWVALGVSGDPGCPDQIAFVPAHTLANDSKEVFLHTDKVSDQYACKREKLQSWLVPNGHDFDQQCFMSELALVG